MTGPLSDNALAKLVLDYMAAHGMTVPSAPGELVIAYVEGMNQDGALNDDAIDGWNDLRLVIEPGPPRLRFKCAATTEPGTYYDRRHVIGTGKGGRRGAALIALGQQACWQVGNHRGDPNHEALVQTGAEVTVYRDYDMSFRRQDGSQDTGWFGINQHGPGNNADGNPTSVGTHSAGCLVARRMADHRAFMALVKTDPRYVANPRFVFSAAVISGRELLGAAQDGPRLPASQPPGGQAGPAPANPPAPVGTAPAAAGAIIDTTQDVTSHLPALRAAGVGAVIRYLTGAASSKKLIRPAEAQAVARAGMALGLVFQEWGGTKNFIHGDITAASGAEHARTVLREAPAVGAPPGCGVYFAIDTDASPAELESLVVPYFRAVHQTIAGRYRVGSYCSGLVAERLRALGLVELIWITCSSGFRGTHDYLTAGKQDLWQSKCDTQLAGLDVDLDVANYADWGQFVPFGSAATPPLVPSAPAGDWPAAWGPQEGDATWYQDSTNADGTPVNNATDMSCATQNRSIPFGTALRITRSDTGASVIVTVHDRGGPALSGSRLVDLRPAASDALDMRGIGVAPVRIERATTTQKPPAPPPRPTPTPPPTAATTDVERKLAAITAAIRPILEEKSMTTSSPDSPPDMWKVLDGITKAVEALQKGETAQPEEEPGFIDKLFGGATIGKALVGKKTLAGGLGLAATVVSNILGFSDSTGTAAQLAMTGFGALTGVGFVGKVERGIKIAKVAIPLLRKIASALGASGIGLPTIWTPPQ